MHSPAFFILWPFASMLALTSCGRWYFSRRYFITSENFVTPFKWFLSSVTARLFNTSWIFACSPVRSFVSSLSWYSQGTQSGYPDSVIILVLGAVFWASAALALAAASSNLLLVSATFRSSYRLDRRSIRSSFSLSSIFTPFSREIFTRRRRSLVSWIKFSLSPSVHEWRTSEAILNILEMSLVITSSIVWLTSAATSLVAAIALKVLFTSSHNSFKPWISLGLKKGESL